MNEATTTPRAAIPPWVIALVAVAALVIATAALTATLVGRGTAAWSGGMMGGGYGPGMMGGVAGGPAGVANGPQPGEAGFVAGTVASPRVIHVIAGPGYAFTPSTITVARGETVTFAVTAMGPAVHEFMVGPADAVAADRDGTPEIADISMMATRTFTFTFDGSGPYAFACHAAGHYEGGMRGAITIVG